MSDDEDASKDIKLEEGRLINHSMFIKDQFNEQANPSYKVEMVYEPDDLDSLYDACYDFAEDQWGEGAADEDAELHIPILDGDKLARKREKKGKSGDAYEGKLVVRATTIFNKHGEDDVGGVQVFNESVKDADKSEIYRGSHGHMVISLGHYQKDKEDEDGDPYQINAITFYLQAYQKTRDGDKLASSTDRKQLFKPVGKKKSDEKSGGGGRKRRKG